MKTNRFRAHCFDCKTMVERYSGFLGRRYVGIEDRHRWKTICPKCAGVPAPIDWRKEIALDESLKLALAHVLAAGGPRAALDFDNYVEVYRRIGAGPITAAAVGVEKARREGFNGDACGILRKRIYDALDVASGVSR